MFRKAFIFLMSSTTLIIGFGSANTLAHESMNDNITIEHAWSRATAPGAVTGATYAIIKNKTDEDLTLTAVKSNIAQTIEMHDMIMDGDIMKMRTLEKPLIIPANSEVEITPHGIHIMLIDINQPLVVEESFPMTFVFSNDDEITVDVNIYNDAEDSMKAHKGMSH